MKANLLDSFLGEAVSVSGSRHVLERTWLVALRNAEVDIASMHAVQRLRWDQHRHVQALWAAHFRSHVSTAWRCGLQRGCFGLPKGLPLLSE